MVPCLFKMFESSHFLIIYFHSNAEDLGVCRWFADFLHEQFQVHVLAVEYPGYGVCPGKATPEGVIANAHAALQFATKTLNISLGRILVFGRSLGTGPAIDLAARHRIAGLVLITPFTSVKDVFRSRVGNLADVLPNDWFQNLEAIKLVRSPTLVVHGKVDDLIPLSHGEAIYKECTARKGLVCPPQMSHNSNITADLSIFVMPMLQFFPIPDCCFEEVEVPTWIYDKSWSPDFKKDEASRRLCWAKCRTTTCQRRDRGSLRPTSTSRLRRSPTQPSIHEFGTASLRHGTMTLKVSVTCRALSISTTPSRRSQCWWIGATPSNLPAEAPKQCRPSR